MQAIVNLFETSQVRSDHRQVTLLACDTGHLTFGRSQTARAPEGAQLRTAGDRTAHLQMRGYVPN